MIVSKNGIEIKPTDKNMPKPSCITYIDDCTSELCTPMYFSFRQHSQVNLMYYTYATLSAK